MLPPASHPYPQRGEMQMLRNPIWPIIRLVSSIFSLICLLINQKQYLPGDIFPPAGADTSQTEINRVDAVVMIKC
jgi:hypothetical protein